MDGVVDQDQRSPSNGRRRVGTGNPPRQDQHLDQIQRSVTHLLVATKQLLESLTQWARGVATEEEVSNVYVRLGYEFNLACRAFSAVGIETSDLGNVPELLRTVLEETLSYEASPEKLDEYLPRIREIIINLLHGLKEKQTKLRARGTAERDSAKDGDEGPPKTLPEEQPLVTSTIPVVPALQSFDLQNPPDDWAVEQAFDELILKRGWKDLPEQALRQMKAYNTSKKWSLVYQDQLSDRQSEQNKVSAIGGGSAKGSSIATLSPESFDLKIPHDRVIEPLFRELMVKRGWGSLSEQARQEMEAYPPSKKWRMIYEWQSEQKTASIKDEGSVETLVDKNPASPTPFPVSRTVSPPASQSLQIGMPMDSESQWFAEYQLKKNKQRLERVEHSPVVIPTIQTSASLPKQGSNGSKLENMEPSSILTPTPKKSSVDLGGKLRRTFGRLTLGERSRTSSPTLVPTTAITNLKEAVTHVNSSSTSSLTPDWESKSSGQTSSDSRLSPLSSGSEHTRQNRAETSTPENFHQDFQASEEEPYQSIRYLGHGGSGSVDEVVSRSDHSRTVYARKQVRLVGRGKHAILERLKQEALIIRSLHHRHIVELVGTYTWSSCFSIIMLPVADTDLGKYLEELDSMTEDTIGGQGDEWLRRTSQFASWTVCLILAVDYLHDMRIKHRDIKPSNILVRNTTVYLTDFGTSRIIPEDATTGTASVYGPMTRRYVAPEALRDSERRGRSTDIFSLGCVLLEMATIQNGGSGARDRFTKLRQDSTDSLSFAENPSATLQWINYLGSLMDQSNRLALDLSFLMLDPDSKHRITARQLVAIVSSTALLEKQASTHSSGCNECHRIILGWPRPDPWNLHSIFRAYAERGYPKNPEDALKALPPQDWETAKKQWLFRHMWWEQPFR